jgi:uncharacterized membrane protein YhaH (DUF805 family)
MKTIFIYIITGIIITIIIFSIHKFISLFIQKEKKIAEELIKKDNGKELIKERIKRNKKRIIIMATCFYLGFCIISFIIILITLYIKRLSF